MIFLNISISPKNINYTIETFTNKVIHDVRNIQKRAQQGTNLVKEEMHEIMEA